MSEVIIHDDENFERALKRFKKKCEKAGILSDLRKHRHYEKPSERRKRKMNAAVRKSYSKIAYQLSKIERKVGREILARDERASGEATYLSNLIYPQKHLQERLYSIIPFLAKHGPDLIGQLAENVHLECPDHQLLVA